MLGFQALRPVGLVQTGWAIQGHVLCGDGLHRRFFWR